jgi:hypothetical protein
LRLEKVQREERDKINKDLDDICVELKKLEYKAYELKARGMAIRVKEPASSGGCHIF